MFYRFIQARCAWCLAYPCECEPLAVCQCMCGATLEATDDLESKRMCAALHSRSQRHRTWRASR